MTKPKESAECHQTLFSRGWGLGTRLPNPLQIPPKELTYCKQWRLGIEALERRCTCNCIYLHVIVYICTIALFLGTCTNMFTIQ